MNIIENKTFDEERALYGLHDTRVSHCRFDGEADGESALKECQRIEVQDSYFNLRYPFWHNHHLKLKNIEMTELCRAALWYCDFITITDSKLHGIKALRECQHITIENTDILSAEFAWSAHDVTMNHTQTESEYFMMRASDIRLKNSKMKGKNSFQYIENAVIENCELDTKDAFWHGKNILVKDSLVKGEYLAWYSENLTFENCTIIGTQPLCYCKNLKLINCKMIDTDLAFERSDVEASIQGHVDSIKNVLSGTVIVDSVDEVIVDIEQAYGKVIVRQTN